MKQVTLITAYCLLSFAAAQSEYGRWSSTLLQPREDGLFHGDHLQPRGDRPRSERTVWSKVKGTGPGLIDAARSPNALDPKFVEPGGTSTLEHHDHTSSIATAWASPEGGQLWPNSNPSFKAKAQGRYVATSLYPAVGSNGRVRISKDGHTETHVIAGGFPFTRRVESNRPGGAKVSTSLNGSGSAVVQGHKDPAGPPESNR